MKLLIVVFSILVSLTSLKSCFERSTQAVVPAATATAELLPTPTLAAPQDGTLKVLPGEWFVFQVGPSWAYRVQWDATNDPPGLYGANTRTLQCGDSYEVFSIDLSGTIFNCGDGLLTIVVEGDGYRVIPTDTLTVTVRPY